jgi:cytochrome P450
MSRIMGQGLVAVNDIAFHRRQRRLIQPVFHMGRIQSYADVMVDYTDRLMRDWQAGSIRDLSEEMMTLTMYIVSKTLYGADMESMSAIAHEVGGAIEVMQEVTDQEFNLPFPLPEWLPVRLNRRRKAARSIVYGTMERMIAARQANGVVDTGDLLSLLLLAEYEDGTRMSPQQVRDELVTLFMAGHETTSNALTWTWYLLSQHPAVEARLHAELDRVLGGRLPTLNDLRDLPYTLQVIKEAMRLYPPAWTLNVRQANADTTLGPFRLNKGDQVFISPYVMQRHSAYWDDPLAFRPERFEPEQEKALPRYAYMPFGGGPRVCIGNSFAMMEAHLIVATMAQRFGFALKPGHPVELNPQITLSAKHGMLMRLTERRPSDRFAPDFGRIGLDSAEFT